MFALLFLLYIFGYSEGQYVVPKIVNGTNAFEGEFPYAVSIRYYNMHECGGSIIGKKWILTAAHCIYPSHMNESKILYGTTNLQNGKSPYSNVANVSRGIMHENYVPSGSYENDIGLIELESELEFNHYVGRVRLPAYREATQAGSQAVLVGWGYPETDGTVMNVLQRVDIIVYSDNDCSKAHDGLAIPKFHICAGVPEGGKGQCTGDSGGPLTVNGTQQGIVSWSKKPCALKGYPGVFTRVSTYRKWIYDYTGI